jgi:hypothetical protein
MEDEKWSSIWLTRDVCYYRGKIVVRGVIVTSSSTTKTVVTLRNGDNATSPIIATLRVSGDDSEQFDFFKPIYCDNGIYADIDANTTGVMVTFKTFKDVGVE